MVRGLEEEIYHMDEEELFRTIKVLKEDTERYFRVKEATLKDRKETLRDEKRHFAEMKQDQENLRKEREHHRNEINQLRAEVGRMKEIEYQRTRDELQKRKDELQKMNDELQKMKDKKECRGRVSPSTLAQQKARWLQEQTEIDRKRREEDARQQTEIDRKRREEDARRKEQWAEENRMWAEENRIRLQSRPDQDRVKRVKPGSDARPSGGTLGQSEHTNYPSAAPAHQEASLPQGELQLDDLVPDRAPEMILPVPVRASTAVPVRASTASSTGQGHGVESSPTLDDTFPCPRKTLEARELEKLEREKEYQTRREAQRLRENEYLRQDAERRARCAEDAQWAQEESQRRAQCAEEELIRASKDKRSQRHQMIGEAETELQSQTREDVNHDLAEASVLHATSVATSDDDAASDVTAETMAMEQQLAVPQEALAKLDPEDRKESAELVGTGAAPEVRLESIQEISTVDRIGLVDCFYPRRRRKKRSQCPDGTPRGHSYRIANIHSAQQSEGAYEARRTRNWCVSRGYKGRPKTRRYCTTIMINHRRHLFPGAAKKGHAWPDHKKTQDPPDRILVPYCIKPTGHHAPGRSRPSRPRTRLRGRPVGQSKWRQRRAVTGWPPDNQVSRPCGLVTGWPGSDPTRYPALGTSLTDKHPLHKPGVLFSSPPGALLRSSLYFTNVLRTFGGGCYRDLL